MSALIARLRTIGIVPLSVPLFIYALLRSPSFFEPHWYTDEAGYATTAREMLRGKLLYVDIWNNKPPLQLWTVAAALQLFGTHEAGLHLVTFVSGLLALGAAAYAAFNLLSTGRAVTVLVAVAVLLGTPMLNAELLIPESLLVAPVSWAGALLLVRINRADRVPGWTWTIPIGFLAAIATAYQQTALAEAGAFALILLVSPRTTRVQLVAYASAFAATTMIWLVPSIILAGPSRVLYALVGFYIPYTTSQLPTDPLHLILLAGAVVLAALIAGVGAFLLRSRAPGSWAAGLWSVATLLAAGAPQHDYPHLLVPAVVPTALLAAGLWRPAGQRMAASPRFRTGVAAVASAALLSGLLAPVTSLDWVPPPSDQGTLTDYYGGLVSVATGQGSLGAWRRSFDARVAPDFRVANWIKSVGLSKSRAVVWSSDAWLYLLADLDEVMPTPPIYNNFALLGDNGEVSAFVESQRPELIVTADEDVSAFPEIVPLLQREYVQVFSSGPEIVWVLKVRGFAEVPAPP